MKVILETDRLRLREMSGADLDFVAAMLSHPEVMRHYPRLYSREEAREWIGRQERRYAADGCGLWLVEQRVGGMPVGQAGLVLQELDGGREPEIGYLLHRPFWKQGFAVEAASAVRDRAWRHLGHDHVISLIRPENLPSQAVARRIGMAPVRETLFHGFVTLVFRLDRGPIAP